MLTYLLMHFGLTPVLLQSGMPVPEYGVHPEAMITDLPMSDERDAALARDIPVLDFAAWRAHNGQPCGRHFNVRALHHWLREHLPAHLHDDRNREAPVTPPSFSSAAAAAG